MNNTIKLISFLLGLLLVSACAARQPLVIKPISGIQFFGPDIVNTIEILDSEILLYQGKTIIGGAQRIKVSSAGKTAIEELKDNLAVAKGGSNKPTIINISQGVFCFSVKTEKFSTIYLATERNTEYWTIISVPVEYYSETVTSIKTD